MLKDLTQSIFVILIK